MSSAKQEPPESDIAAIHEYLVRRLGHNWRLETWRDKYAQRLKKYGLSECKTAVDGFCSMKWFIEFKSQDGPDLIFRSDKQFEKFLAAGKKAKKSECEKLQTSFEDQERREKLEVIRKDLEEKNGELTARFQRKIEVIKDDINEQSWKVFIAPLLFVKKEGGAVVLFHEDAEFVQEHYGARIEKMLGCKINIVSNIWEPVR